MAMSLRTVLKSYLGVCVDVGYINQAFDLVVKNQPAKNVLCVELYNIILRGWAQVHSVPKVIETRMHMINDGVEPNIESYAYIMLAYSRQGSSQGRNIRKFLMEMRNKNLDAKRMFQVAYMNPSQRSEVKALLKTFDPKYEEIFHDEPTTYNNSLLDNMNTTAIRGIPDHLVAPKDMPKLEAWADQQRNIESKSSVVIKSVARQNETSSEAELYGNVWKKLRDIWRAAFIKSLDDSMKTMRAQFFEGQKLHLYPYLKSIDRNLLLNIMLDEVDTNAVFSSFSISTNSLHSMLGTKVMNRYRVAKSISDGSYEEQQKIYNEYLKEYCTNPILMSKMNSREYIQAKALITKNYSLYKEKYQPFTPWPEKIITGVGKFLYGIMLREVKFDYEVVANPKRELKEENYIHAFYTAYFQIDGSPKIKEEFRAHQDFEKLHHKSSYFKLKFDHSFLPCSSPPMPWLYSRLGGYLTASTELVRVRHHHGSGPDVEIENFNQGSEKLYPTLDSLNVLGLCPWIVNTEVLEIVIGLFKLGGDENLSVPLDESKMKFISPLLKEDSTKVEKILYNKEKKKFDQSKKEMYSLWRDCLYRLSIANHFRDKIFWLPHNLDFRGRTYPVPPHFNHLGADLARSLLLFANGKPLGKTGLDWLKIHLINLTGTKKSSPLHLRLEFANSIMPDILDSAEKPWEGRRWWAKQENPWQVLSCCKEILKASRSPNHEEYISHFPVHQDGSCNGLQHYAALGRDCDGARAVNLIPCDAPQDVYSRVVDIVEEMRKRDAKKGLKEAKLLEGLIQRKVIKQTVMTTVYGVTRYGARLQIAKQLASKDIGEREIWSAAQYLTAKTFDSIGKMFNTSRLIQDWLTKCAGIIASKYRKPVSWHTPLGFLVVQPYRHVAVPRKDSMILPSLIFNKSLDPCFLTKDSKFLNTSKQRTAFPPNYIHSLDSTHMMLTSLYCDRAGITFVSVHDCFWTHPSTVDLMNKICRQQFVAMHSEPLLLNLSNEFMEGLEASEQHQAVLKEVPIPGNLDLSSVLDSTYFFS